MKVIKNETNILLKNEKGEYHFSIEEFNKIGEEEAIKIATKEIEKKVVNSNYTNATINFNQARELGFCEYGIKDFCKMLSLNIDKSYSIKELSTALTINAFLEYPDECSKLFGKEVIVTKFGGIKKMLQDNRTRKMLNFVFKSGLIEDKKLHLLACDFAEKTLNNFESSFPNDDRPRKAIEIKRLWIEEEYANE